MIAIAYTIFVYNDRRIKVRVFAYKILIIYCSVLDSFLLDMSQLKRALPLLEITGDKCRVIKDNLVHVLKKVKNRPFACISINGSTRTGKSNAINHVIQRLEFKATNKGKQTQEWFTPNPVNRFRSAAGRDPVTVGINLWSEPFFVQDDRGREIAILLMDCQGLFDVHTTAKVNSVIFFLSSLCSSVFILNLMKNVDEKDLQNLEFLMDMARLTTVDGQSLQNSNEATQKLLFLLHDFDSQEFEYGLHTSTTNPPNSSNFIQFLLHQTSTAHQENVQVHERIKQSFRDVSAFLLPYPGLPFIRNQQPADQLFLDNMKSFVTHLVQPSTLCTKHIFGAEVTGEGFMKYFETCIPLLENSSGSAMSLKNILQSTATVQCEQSLKAAESLYMGEMDIFFRSNKDGLPAAQFVIRHQTLKQKSINEYQRRFKIKLEINQGELHESPLTKLEETIEKLYKQYETQNGLLQSKAETERELQRQMLEVERLERERKAKEALEAALREKMRKQLEEVQRQQREKEARDREAQQRLAQQLAEAERVRKGKERLERAEQAIIQAERERLEREKREQAARHAAQMADLQARTAALQFQGLSLEDRRRLCEAVGVQIGGYFELRSISADRKTVTVHFPGNIMHGINVFKSIKVEVVDSQGSIMLVFSG